MKSGGATPSSAVATSPIGKWIFLPRLATTKGQSQVNSLPSTATTRLQFFQQQASFINTPTPNQLDDQNELDASLTESFQGGIVGDTSRSVELPEYGQSDTNLLEPDPRSGKKLGFPKSAFKT